MSRPAFRQFDKLSQNKRRIKSLEEQDIILKNYMAQLHEAKKAKTETRQFVIPSKHEQQPNARRTKERRKQRQREAEEQQRRDKEKRALSERMLSLQISFRMAYYDITSISEPCKDGNIAGPAFAPHSANLKELGKCMEGLVEYAKMGDLTEADVNTAKILVKQSEKILNVFRLEIDRVIAVHEADIAGGEKELRRIQAQARHVARRSEQAQEYQPVVHGSVDSEQNNVAQVPEARLQPNSTESTDAEASARIDPAAATLLEFGDKDSLQLYRNSQKFLEYHTTLCSSLTNSDATKKFRFECQKAVNIPVNAISGASGEHLLDKFGKLCRLLAGQPPVNANQHPEGIAFCKDILAKKIVSQGEELVSSDSEIPFSLAAVTVALWSEYPDFGELLLAYFHKTCPYLVPLFLPQQQGQSNVDCYKSLGYKYSEDGTVEGQHQFLKRMSGIMRLYAALTITKQRNGVDTPHPHGLQNAWRWLAAMLKIEPRHEVCATLILDMLEVAGHSLWKTYPNKFRKLLNLLASQYYPRMQAFGCTGGGPLTRLEQFLNNCSTKGTIPSPHGQLPPNFW